MQTSAKLNRILENIQPETRNLSREEIEALWSLTFERYPFLSSAEITLTDYGIQHNSSGQGENARWRKIVEFPLSIKWEASFFEGNKVLFKPRLICHRLLGEDWIFNKFASVIFEVEPLQERFLTDTVIFVEGEPETFCCLLSEVSSTA